MTLTMAATDTAATLVAPERLEDVVRLLEQHGDDAKVLAGGQSLLVFLRKGLVQPTMLVSLRRVRELTEARPHHPPPLRIGAASFGIDRALQHCRGVWERTSS
jgi:CO/xanthine dehydrogenase FAD-binding subunit